MKVKRISDKGMKLLQPKVSDAFSFPQTVPCSYCHSDILLESIADIDLGRYDVGYSAYDYRLCWKCPICKAQNGFSYEEIDIKEWKRRSPFRRFLPAV